MFESYLRRPVTRRGWHRPAGYLAAIALHGAMLGALVLAPARTPPAAISPSKLAVRLGPSQWALLHGRDKTSPAPKEKTAPEPPAKTQSRVTPPGKPERRARRSPRPPLARRSPTLTLPSHLDELAQPAAPPNPATSSPSPSPSVASDDPPTAGESPGPALASDRPENAAGSPASLSRVPREPAPLGPRFLPEPLANQQKLSGAPPEFPAALARGGAHFVAQARICVASSGRVERVEILKSAHPQLDANVVQAVHTWRYRPLLAGASAIPFCTLARFEFRAI